MKRKPEYISAREAADRLALPIEQVRAMVRAGILRGGRPGGFGFYRIEIRSIEEYLMRRQG